MIRLRVSAAAGLGLLAFLTTALPSRAQEPGSGSDSAAIVRTVERFHELITAGDSLGALGLLTEDAVILESGGLETKAEFRAHHLGADIGFARSSRVQRRVAPGAGRGEAARGGAASAANPGTGGGGGVAARGGLHVPVPGPPGGRHPA